MWALKDLDEIRRDNEEKNRQQKSNSEEQFELKILSLLGECYLNLRIPHSAIIMADKMEDVLSLINEDYSISSATNWKSVQQSLYARSYLISLSIGQARPKTPSNKVKL